ncbi:apolipo protein O-domain-containing protein [Globomyces pollinis-pini]|nr:apolipo protein O-domain-containing protein [Globomyces pollinis-pini]
MSINLYDTKKSIYSDTPGQQQELTEEPTQLELEIRKARHIVTKAFSKSIDQIQTGVDTWISFEKSVRDVITTYHDKREAVLPGMLYVTIAGFAGSIAVKNKNFAIRVFFPMVTSVGTFGALYPLTTINILKNQNFDPTQLPPKFTLYSKLVDKVEDLIHAVGWDNKKN